ncbi:hypothetical protein [Haloferula sargassicola]|uniref:Uncharacterized protein n=1 Tax=Haloferula sargassicola TaxID=490096 RepID=A0ABP9UKK5_9BACT
MKSWVVLGSAITAGVLSAAAGWAAAGKAPSAGGPDSARLTERHGAKATLRPQRSREVDERLAKLHAARNPEDRIRLAVALAHELSLDELRQWFEGNWLRNDGDLAATIFYRVARQRWLEEDPEGLFRYDLKHDSDYLAKTAECLGQRDPAAALEMMRGKGAARVGPAAAAALLKGLARTDPAAAREAWELFRQIPGVTDDYRLNVALEALALWQPGVLEASMDELPDKMRRQALTITTRLALQADFSAEMARLAADPDGFRRFEEVLKTGGGELLLPEHLGDLPKEWIGWLGDRFARLADGGSAEAWLDQDLAAMGVDEGKVEQIRFQALFSLVWSHPEEVFKRMAHVAMTADQRASLIQQTMRALLQQDPEQARRMASELDDPEDVAQAAASIDQYGDEREGQSEKKSPDPRTWLESLVTSEWDDPFGGAPTYPEADEAKKAELVREFRSMDEPARISVARKLFADGGTSSPAGDPLAAAAARELMLHPPEGADWNGTEFSSDLSRFTVNWADEAPAEAAAWAKSLPAGEPGNLAARNVALRWADYDPAAARAWARTLPAEMRAAVMETLGPGR